MKSYGKLNIVRQERYKRLLEKMHNMQLHNLYYLYNVMLLGLSNQSE
jgi:hypothetical protein